MEYRIATTPQQQRWSRFLGKHGGAHLKRCIGRISRGHRNVGHEVPDGVTSVGPPVGGAQCVPMIPLRHEGRPLNEERGAPATQVDQTAGQGDERRHRHAFRFGHGGVAQN
jgi:hypothetical protein